MNTEYILASLTLSTANTEGHDTGDDIAVQEQWTATVALTRVFTEECIRGTKHVIGDRISGVFVLSTVGDFNVSSRN